MKEDSRILLIVYYYAPLNCPRVFRWQPLAEEFVRIGHSVDVITCAYHDLLKFEIINGVNVYRIPPWFFKSLYRKNRIKNLYVQTSPDNDKQAVGTLRRPPKGMLRILRAKGFQKSLFGVKDFFISSISKIFHKIWWPDFGMFWIIPAWNKSRELIRINCYEKVFVISWPVSAHAVGLLLSNNLMHSSVSLIVDVGDPFSTNEHNQGNNQSLYRKLNYLFEKRLYKAADGISVTSPRLQLLFAKKFAVPSKKIMVIPPLFTGENSANNHSTSSKRSNFGILRVVFIGSLRRKNRPPDILIRLITEVSGMMTERKIELHLAGDISECSEFIERARIDLHGTLFTEGVIPRIEAQKMAIHADILVNIGNLSQYQIPSKLVDYVATGNPIVNIQLAPLDSSLEFLKDYPALCNLDFSQGNYDFNLKKFIEFLTNPPDKVPQEKIAGFLNTYSLDSISRMYLSNWWS